VRVVNKRGEAASSGTICSGRVSPNDTANREVAVVLPDDHCDASWGLTWKDICSIDVLSADGHAPIVGIEGIARTTSVTRTEEPPRPAAEPPISEHLQKRPLPYLFEQLRKATYKKSFEALFVAESKIEPWLAKFIADRDGVCGPGLEVHEGDRTYEAYSVCQPHNCQDNFFYVVFDRGGMTAWALFTKDDNTSRFLGAPNERMQRILYSLRK